MTEAAAPGRPTAAGPLAGSLLIALVFTLTGALGIILQVVWQRELSLLFGNTIEATGAVLAAFLGSLALGSAWLGPRADRSADPLRYYAWLEIAAGIGALFSMLALPWLGRIGVAAFRVFDGESLALALVRGALAFLLVAPATVPMGATLAALSAAVACGRSGGERLSLLYALNTLGAALGAAAAAFVLVLLLGLRATWLLAAGGDLVLGLGVLALASRRAAAGERARREGDGRAGSETRATRQSGEPGTATGRRDLPALMLLSFASGLTLLGLEVLWTRALVLHLGSHVATFALVLAVVLLGLGAGALIAGRLASGRRDLIAWAGAASLAAAVSGLWGLVALRELSDFMGNLAITFRTSTYWGAVLIELLAALRVALLPALFGGMVFPLAMRAAFEAADGRPGARVGWLIAASTTGTLAGSLGTAMLLVPALGVGRGFVVLLLLELGIGAVLLPWRVGARRALLPTAAALVAAALLVRAAAPVERVLFAAGVFSDPDVKVLFSEDGLHGLITVEQRQDPGDPAPYRSISVNGVNVAGTTPDLIETQKLQAHIPLLVAKRPRTVLHIGVGSGGTAASVALHPVERIDVVELNPRVPPAADLFFKDQNHGVLFADPRIHIVYGDGRNWLLSSDRLYDVILSDSIHPRFAGNGALYTRDYYRICRERLAPGGVISQWLPLYSLPPEAYRMIVRAFLDVFPQAILWYPHGTFNANSILIGARDDFSFSTRSLAAAMAAPAIAADLASIGVHSPEDFLSNFLAGRRGLERLAGDAPAHTDDRPLVEYAAGRLHGEQFGNYRTWTWARNLEALAAVREPWDPEAPEARRAGARIARYRAELERMAP